MCNLNLQQNTPYIWGFFSLERIIHAVNGVPGRGTGEEELRMAEQFEKNLDPMTDSCMIGTYEGTV